MRNGVGGVTVPQWPTRSRQSRSISPIRSPPCRARPSVGCLTSWLTGPRDRACTLSECRVHPSEVDPGRHHVPQSLVKDRADKGHPVQRLACDSRIQLLSPHAGVSRGVQAVDRRGEAVHVGEWDAEPSAGRAHERIQLAQELFPL
jgi:hypothetical protein